ncbi:AraC family transcriptional regulator [Actinomadura livida]|uniref:AraC family transcriptional regulator n=1 Tax=Actinomadura livida TaxID=79909 RepID=A0A7W7MZX9_9ACTN|nr:MULTISPECIES: AraC family transcriptional regulator [Actinomadura]MBB4776330.1 AraC-like DNA-binding protein [Actinomadura catellatispora]GGU32488.1 transcriptional regulator [Actinomadura livida]
MGAEVAYHYRHPALPDVDLLRARFVTHRFNRHTHDGYVFGVIEAGVEEFELGTGVERAGTGSVVVVNPGVVHGGHAGTPEGWAYRVLYPPVDVVTGVAADLGARPGTPAFPDPVLDDPAAAEMLRAVHRAGEKGDALAASTLLRTALAGLLTRHARVRGHRASAAVPPAVREARDILHANLVDPPSLDRLAEAVGTRPFPLLRAFRDTVGLPPHAYLNQVRVRAARALLDEGLPPADVAARTGFADQAHLTRHFKRTLGVPPGAYRSARGIGRVGARGPREAG